MLDCGFESRLGLELHVSFSEACHEGVSLRTSVSSCVSSANSLDNENKPT